MPSNSPTDVAPALPVSKPARWRAVLTRSAFVAAALLTLIAGFYVVERGRGNAAWHAYQTEARTRGVKLMLAEYVPPPVPDERNFAAIPLFQDAFKTPQPPNPLAWSSPESAKPPPLGAVYKGEPIDIREWQKFFVEKKTLATAGDNPAADVLQALDRYAPQLEQLHIAGQRPDSRFPVNYDAGIGALLPHLQILNSAARIYALRLAAHLALGDRPAAYEDFRGSFRLYTALHKEPTLISGLVRLSVLAMMEGGIADGLARRQWGDAELEKIAADLGHVRVFDDYTLGLGSERGLSNMFHEQLVANGSSELANLLAMTTGWPGPGSRMGGVIFSLYPSGWLRLSQTRSNRYFDEMLARVSQEPPRVYPERAVPDYLEGPLSPFDRMRYLLFLNLAPALGEVERSYAYGQALLDETRLGCALERHRLAHGSFPASLEALVPAYLPALPRDVMTGDPLHYRLEAGDGYTLYSVGWNLQDDGGKVDAKAPARQQPDWVWLIRPS